MNRNIFKKDQAIHNQHLPRLPATAASASVLLMALNAGPAQAATITVDETAVTPCTLVDAITSANTDTAVGNWVVF